jgi:hypothetical protein
VSRSTGTPPGSARSLGELPDDTLIRGEDVARFLGCSARTVQRAGIPAVEIRPRVRRYFVRDVLGWLERQRNGPGR